MWKSSIRLSLKRDCSEHSGFVKGNYFMNVESFSKIFYHSRIIADPCHNFIFQIQSMRIFRRNEFFIAVTTKTTHLVVQPTNLQFQQLLEAFFCTFCMTVLWNVQLYNLYYMIIALILAEKKFLKPHLQFLTFTPIPPDILSM